MAFCGARLKVVRNPTLFENFSRKFDFWILDLREQKIERKLVDFAFLGFKNTRNFEKTFKSI